MYNVISGIIKVFGFLLISETGRGFTGDGGIHGCSDNSRHPIRGRVQSANAAQHDP